MNLRFDRRSAATAVAANRHFVAFTLLIALVLGLFPGSPGQIFLAGSPAPPPQPTAVVAPEPSAPSTSAAPAPPPPPPPATDGTTTTEAAVEAEPFRITPRELPPREPRPPLVCDSDGLFDLLGEIRTLVAPVVGEVFDLLFPGEEPHGGQLPGASLEELARVATGCIDRSPEAVMLEIAFDFANTMPPLGLDPIPLPPLPGEVANLLQLPIPADVIALFGPFREAIAEACSTTLFLIGLAPVLMPSFQVPLRPEDLQEWSRPVAALCATFFIGEVG